MVSGGGTGRDPRADARLRVLAETMRAFVESTDDYQALLVTVAERVTHDLCDACLIGLVSEDGGRVIPAAFTARDEAVTGAMAASFASAHLKVDHVGIAMSVIHSGEPVLIAAETPEGMAARVSPLFADLVRRVGVHALISVPLHVHGRCLGAVSLYRYRPSSPPFDEADLFFARCLADHAALAIDNARTLHSLQRELVERQRAEEEAQTFVALVENSTDFIAMADIEGRVLFVNDAGRKLVGLDPAADVRSLTLRDFHTEEGLGRAGIIKQFGSWRGEGQLKHFQSGAHIPVRVSSFIVRDVHGKPTGFATLQQDIRATQALEAQLRHAQKMEAVGQLAGGIAHDFNNLLTVILSYSSLLAGTLADGSEEKEDLEQIELAGQRAAKLTGQLLAFSRQQVLEPKVLDLNAIVDGMRLMARRAVSEDIEIRTQLADGLFMVEADEGQVEQVILNLVVNARDAMPTGGTVTISTENVVADASLTANGLAPGDHVMLVVRDTGQGMDEATMARIFDPFFTTKPVGKGTGLGLATVIGIINQSGGHVLVESEPGQGAAFKVYLPRSSGEAKRTPIAPRPEIGRALGGSETILLVDDEAQVRVLMRNVLRRAGYQVIEALGPEEALAAAAATSGEIHLLLTDVIMPKMSGRRLAERLSASRPNLRVLFVSGYTEDAIGSHGVLEPGIQLVRKPLTPDVLLRRVRVVLDGRDKAATSR